MVKTGALELPACPAKATGAKEAGVAAKGKLKGLSTGKRIVPCFSASCKKSCVLLSGRQTIRATIKKIHISDLTGSASPCKRKYLSNLRKISKFRAPLKTMRLSSPSDGKVVIPE